MNNATKQHIMGIVSVVCAIGMVVSISKMIPYGLGGEVAKVKQLFVLLLIFLVAGLPSAIAYYYYRQKAKSNADLEHTRIEVNSLANVGQKTTETNGPARNTSQTASDKRGINIR